MYIDSDVSTGFVAHFTKGNDVNLHQYIIGYPWFNTDKVRARKIHLGTQMMNLPVRIDSGKETEP